MDKETQKTQPQTSKQRGNPSPCPICGVIISNSYGLSCHIRRHNNVRPFKCDQCMASFILVTELQRHQVAHLKTRPFKCAFCPKDYKDERTLKLHLDSHGVNEYQCRHCDVKFRSIISRGKHELNFHDDNALRCKYCHKTFSEFKYKELHESNYHKKKAPKSQKNKNKRRGPMPNVDNNLKTFDSNFKFYPCKICPERFRFRKDQISHYQTNHTDKFLEAFKVCKLCAKVLTTEHFPSHMEAHEGKFRFECSDCDYKSNRKNDLKNHTLIHSKAYNFKCSYCHKSFSKKAPALDCEQRHIGKKEVKCHICDMTFYSQLELRRHDNTDHKVKKCLLCGYETLNKYTFTCHKKTHGPKLRKISKNSDGQEKSHMCDKCGALFSSSLGLAKHSLNHSTLGVVKSNKVRVCSYCDFKGASNSDILTHCLETHPSKVNKCEICTYITLNTRHFVSHMKNHINKSGEELYVFAGINQFRKRKRNSMFMECCFCGFSSAIREKMEKHIEAHDKMLRKLPWDFACPHKTYNNKHIQDVDSDICDNKQQRIKTECIPHTVNLSKILSNECTIIQKENKWEIANKQYCDNSSSKSYISSNQKDSERSDSEDIKPFKHPVKEVVLKRNENVLNVSSPSNAENVTIKIKKIKISKN